MPDVEIVHAVRYAGRSDRRFQGALAETTEAAPAEGAVAPAIQPSDFADTRTGAPAPKSARPVALSVSTEPAYSLARYQNHGKVLS